MDIYTDIYILISKIMYRIILKIYIYIISSFLNASFFLYFKNKLFKINFLKIFTRYLQNSIKSKSCKQ